MPVMKFVLVLAAVLLGGCSVAGGKVKVPQPVVAAASDVDVVQRVPFVMGVSSATVEKLGKAEACVSAQGAGLVTEPGPIEVYRMQCETGQVFMARCELRQCRKM